MMVVQELAAHAHVPATVIGTVGGENPKIALDGKEIITLPIDKLKATWREAIACSLK